MAAIVGLGSRSISAIHKNRLRTFRGIDTSDTSISQFFEPIHVKEGVIEICGVFHQCHADTKSPFSFEYSATILYVC